MRTILDSTVFPSINVAQCLYNINISALIILFNLTTIIHVYKTMNFVVVIKEDMIVLNMEEDMVVVAQFNVKFGHTILICYNRYNPQFQPSQYWSKYAM